MKNALLAVVFLASTLLPAASVAPAQSLVCKIVPNQIGQPVCWCKSTRPGSRWGRYLMVVCEVVQ